MDLALREALKAGERGEVPVGAVIADARGEVLAYAGNRNLELNDPTAHAEIVAIRAACAAMGSQRLEACDLHVTLEPCAMCAAAISLARMRRVYYAAADEKMGAVDHGPRFFAQACCHHRPEIYGGIGEEPACKLLKGFFAARR